MGIGGTLCGTGHLSLWDGRLKWFMGLVCTTWSGDILPCLLYVVRSMSLCRWSLLIYAISFEACHLNPFRAAKYPEQITVLSCAGKVVESPGGSLGSFPPGPGGL